MKSSYENTEELKKAVRDSVNVYYLLRCLYLVSDNIGHIDIPDIGHIIQGITELAADTLDEATATLSEFVRHAVKDEEGDKCSE